VSVRVEVTSRNGVAVVRLTGELDLTNVEEVGRRLEPAEVSPAVVLDLSALAFLDSAAVHLLFSLARRRRDEGRALAVVVPAGSPVERLVAIVDLGRAAPVRTTLDAALTAVGAAP
jgi:anti-anti-sigma factor